MNPTPPRKTKLYRKKTRKDVAWGFFYGTADNINIRIMWTRNAARIERRAYYNGWNPGNVFKIVPPTAISELPKAAGRGRK